MATTTFEACKKRKRTPNIFTIHNLGTNPEATTDVYDGPFRENIREFLKQYAESEDYSVGGNSVWCISFVSESNGVVFPLYVVEENVKFSSRPLCDLCRCVGWSHHFVSKRIYHMIIPEVNKWKTPLKKGSLDLQSHLLHGAIHCNGFGHLLCINGVEASSRYLHGKELMNLWDHLCTVLQAREISVHDLSKKESVELRLLHGVAYGRSWFGKWGYKLCCGSFGVTRQKYDRAIEVLSSLELNMIIQDFINTNQGKLIVKIIQTYRDVSGKQLVTIADLFRFMLAFKSEPLIRRKTAFALASIAPKATPKGKNGPLQGNSVDDNSLASFVAKLNSRWPEKRLVNVVKVIFDILQTSGATMCRQELRDAIRQHVGDTGLIDFVVKNIDQVTMNNQIIHRTTNPITKLAEYSLQDVANRETTERKTQPQNDAVTVDVKPGLDVYKDLLFLYQNVLLGYPDHHLASTSTKSILDCKFFFKEWQFTGNSNDMSLRLICRVRPSYDELATVLTRPLPPGELVVVPQCATINELKLKVQSALRDTYFVMDKFVVREIKVGELERREEQDLLLLMCAALEQSVLVLVRGCGLNLGTKLIYQGGADNWRVECCCGARDDDGEKMVACDVCHVWQHTRCNDIDDDRVASTVFLCCKCKARMK